MITIMIMMMMMMTTIWWWQIKAFLRRTARILTTKVWTFSHYFFLPPGTPIESQIIIIVIVIVILSVHNMSLVESDGHDDKCKPGHAATDFWQLLRSMHLRSMHWVLHPSHHARSLWEHNNNTTTMFMVLSSWHSHWQSSPNSFDKCRRATRGRRPLNQVSRLGR